MNVFNTSYAPVETNFFGYRIINNATGETPTNVSAAFRYRGYEIAFHTFNPAGSKVSVMLNHVFIADYGTVEAAVVGINERIAASHDRDWQGAHTRSGRDAVRSLQRNQDRNNH